MEKNGRIEPGVTPAEDTDKMEPSRYVVNGHAVKEASSSVADEADNPLSKELTDS